MTLDNRVSPSEGTGGKIGLSPPPPILETLDKEVSTKVCLKHTYKTISAKALVLL